MRQCHEALDNGWLVAIDLAQPHERHSHIQTRQRRPSMRDEVNASRDKEDGQNDQDEQEEQNEQNKSDAERYKSNDVPSESENEPEVPDPPNNTAESSNRTNVDLDFLHSSSTFKEGLGNFDDETINSFQLNQRLVDFQGRMFESILHMALKKNGRELKGRFKVRYSQQNQELRSAMGDLDGQLQLRTEELEVSQHRVVGLETERQSLLVQLVEKDNEIETKIERAKDEAREEERRKTIDDMSTSMESDLSALRKSHLEHVNKVRTDAYRLGYEAGQKEFPTMSGESSTSMNRSSQISTDIEALKKIREAQREALETGRREGREMAYQELALSPADRVNILISNQDSLNKNRKIRELKTIHQNWNDVPQVLLPSYMLPEGHTPGDKTLYLLAKLSKEVDKDKAVELLEEEIDQRCRDQQSSRTLTNADVQNALNKMSFTNVKSSAMLVECSQPPSVPQSTATENSKEKRPYLPQKGKQHIPQGPASQIVPSTVPSTLRSSSPNLDNGAAMCLQTHFTTSLQIWLDLNEDATDPGFLPSSSIKKAMLTETRFRELKDMVIKRSSDAGMLGRQYKAIRDVKTLKSYIAGLAIELSSSFELPNLSTLEDVVEVFKAIYSIFLSENANVVAQNNTTNTTQKDTARSPKLSQPRAPLPKRPRTDDKPISDKVKRQKLKSRQSLPQRRVGELRREEREKPAAISGSTITVDILSLPDVKGDTGGEMEDLYGATPPPRGKKWPRKSVPE